METTCAFVVKEGESDACGVRREEFLSAFEEQVAVLRRQEEIQAELEACGSDMDRMAPILDELDALSKKVSVLPASDVVVASSFALGTGTAECCTRGLGVLKVPHAFSYVMSMVVLLSYLADCLIG